MQRGTHLQSARRRAFTQSKTVLELSMLDAINLMGFIQLL
jgi:hypothetical protein